MTATVTIKARAVPVTVKVSDDAEPITVDPWQEKQVHVDGSAHLTITEAEPAAGEAPADGDEATTAAEEPDEEPEAADRGYSRRRRAPAADSDDTQIG